MEVSATAMLPHHDADRARNALRARLHDIVERRQIPPAELEGATMLVAGPTVVTDAAGRTWYEWAATLRIRGDSPGPRADDDAGSRPTVDDLGLLPRHAG